MKYPIRCQIIDVGGEEIYPGIIAKTPEISKPYIGQLGVARRLLDGNVRITLDNGVVLMGYECWWSPKEY